MTDKLTADQALKYAKLLKMVLGADGEIAEAEMNALRHNLLKRGAPAKFVERIEAFEIDQLELSDVLPDIKADGLRARLLIYDAIRIASADGTYADREREAVAQVAELLGVAAEITASLEALVQMEKAMGDLKKALFP